MAEPVREIVLPFAIDPLGRVAFTTDPVKQVSDHIVSIVGTVLGERVMRPQYGAGLPSYVFATNDDVALSLLQVEIETAVSAYEPAAVVSAIEPVQDDDGLLGVNVLFSLLGIEEAAGLHTAYIAVGGTVVSARG